VPRGHALGLARRQGLDRRIGAHVHGDAERHQRAAQAEILLRPAALVVAAAGGEERGVERVRHIELGAAALHLVEADGRLRLYHARMRTLSKITLAAAAPTELG